MIFRNGLLNRRDALLLLIGASSMHIWSLLFSPQPAQSDIFINTHVSQGEHHETSTFTTTVLEQKTVTGTKTVTSVVTATPTSRALSAFDKLPATEVLGHAPGWTLFKNLYMTNGTLFIVADEADRKVFPEMRMMTSTGRPALNTPEDIAMREPRPENMQFITPKQAKERWATTENVNRVWTVEGNTLLFNDPSQFLRHYYHFVAELFFGVQAFWHGAFSKPIPHDALTNPTASVHYSTEQSPTPPIHRAIFAHSNANGWRDDPGFDSYFLRAAYPSLIVEHQEDWEDRIRASLNSDGERAWHFPMLLLTDRSASFRGQYCGAEYHRTAGEAWNYMRLQGKLHGIHVGAFWAPIREAIWRFAGTKEGMQQVLAGREARQQVHFGTEMEVTGLDPRSPTVDPKKVVDFGAETQRKLPRPDKIVISYITRQSAHVRKLIKEDDVALIESLKELVQRKNDEYRDFKVKGNKKVDKDGKTVEPSLPWELVVLQAEKLSKEAQIQAAERTTIMLGVHGNGLTHLIFMKPNRYSTVIELFFPKGFAQDYQWTAHSLGMSHFPVWNDTYHIWPKKPIVDYVDGFQGNSIPAHGPTVVQIIEDRIAGKL